MLQNIIIRYQSQAAKIETKWGNKMGKWSFQHFSTSRADWPG